MGQQNGDCLFLIIYKDQKATYSIFFCLFEAFWEAFKDYYVVWPVLLLCDQSTTKGMWIGLQKGYWHNKVLFWYPHPKDNNDLNNAAVRLMLFSWLGFVSNTSEYFMITCEC